MTSKNSSFAYSGHMLEILILGIVVCFNISRSKYGNFVSSGLVEFEHHRAAKFIHVITISFHH
jgi:hypothetical protein